MKPSIVPHIIVYDFPLKEIKSALQDYLNAHQKFTFKLYRHKKLSFSKVKFETESSVDDIIDVMNKLTVYGAGKLEAWTVNDQVIPTLITFDKDDGRFIQHPKSISENQESPDQNRSSTYYYPPYPEGDFQKGKTLNPVLKYDRSDPAKMVRKESWRMKMDEIYGKKIKRFEIVLIATVILLIIIFLILDYYFPM